MTIEDRLRELLHDPEWSLPAWPDGQARVRRAARRQRMTLVRVAGAITAVVTTAAVVPVLLFGRGLGPGLSSAASPFALPPLGAAGFASAIYPAPVQARTTARWLSLCPSTAGLQAPDQNAAMAGASLAVLRQLTPPVIDVAMVEQRYAPVSQLAAQYRQQVLASDLPLSDRALWPRLASASASGSDTELTEVVQAARFLPVLYSGPLGAYHPAGGPRSLAKVVAADCGSRIVRDTWVVVSGHPASPARAAETLFLERHGRVLLYNATARPD
jgi:hypothetical protein